MLRSWRRSSDENGISGMEANVKALQRGSKRSIGTPGIKAALGYTDGDAGSTHGLGGGALQLACTTDALKPRRCISREEWDAMGSL